VRYRSLHERLIDAVLRTPGATCEWLRRAVLERAQGKPGPRDAVPPALAHYVDTVARHAYRVMDADVRALQTEGGQSDDAVFEVTVVAAVGAAMYRLERGMAALRGEEHD
jgi:hypothetical protein